MLRPLVYAEPLRLVEQHRERGEGVFIVSATLQEIVEAIAEDLGFDGGLGTICEVRDGRYTGRALRALHAEAKAECLREVAARDGLDLAACTAYSDSHTDLPFLEAVGHPVAVNPDRALRGSRPIAAGRARVQRPATRMRAARPRALVVGSRCSGLSPRGRVDAEEGLGRRASASATPTRRSCGSTSTRAERRGKQGHGHARIPWLEGLEGYDPAAEPRLLEEDEGFQRWHGGGAIGYLVLGARRARASSSARLRMLASSSASGPSRRGCSATTCAGSPTAGSSAMLTATSPARLGHPSGGPKLAGTNPLAIGIPSSATATRSSSTSRWAP